ncbi:MAG: LysR substrate-binding domain-containing protein [Pseudopelagicola sp.]|nr:LysR substrate-binding domain-containing protein [Pseudopelagicola sp.]
MRSLNLNALPMFDAAARHLNLQKAADEMHLTHGAVAQQVRALEARLGTKLFTRLPRGLALTEAGARYHGEIRRALAQIDNATAELKAPPSSVTLSLPPSLAAKWLVARLADFSERHPTITLQTHASEALSNFRRDGIDLAIRQGPKPQTSDLIVHPLAAEDLRAVASPAYLDGITEIPGIEGYSRHKLIEDIHHHWTRLFRDANLRAPASRLSFNQTALAIDAATNGQGIALAPRLLVTEALSQGYLRSVWPAPTRPVGFYIVHPSGPNPARDTVVNWLLSQGE